MVSKHPVVSLIEKLYQSRDIVAELYDADDILQLNIPDKRTQNLVNNLVNAQFIVPSGTDNYSLDTDLTRIIDKGLRQDTISYLHSDIGGEVAKIRQSFITYANIGPGTHDEVRRKNKRELIKLFLALSHRFNSTAEELFRRTQVNFGRTDYSRARALENKYYLEELEKLKSSYHEVITLLDADEFHQEALIDDLVTTFKGRTMQFFDKVGQTLSLLKAFAYRERKQEEKTKLMRRLIKHLDDNPTLLFDDTIEAGGELNEFALPKAICMDSTPDLANPTHLDSYLSILEKLKKTLKPKESFKRSRSSCDTSKIPKKEHFLTLSDKLLKQMILHVLKLNKPTKASDILKYFDPNNELPPQLWNYTILHAFFTRRKVHGHAITKHLQHKPIYAEFSKLSGNRHVKDAIIAPKRLPKEFLENV
ncbi:hypothetical protein [Thalassotalea profundi]|uniref:Uncharacterized protein n=1 Tax=Thalassotalea profundi TaxID=2036687 RepID=A0ABQ3ID93_9GAMM|nr:hypothetical protein [Thalassotalea profundi]GHE80175.1 hypothetical protein GCM10011501_05010 [Thalassotalea profundi]